MSMIGADVEQLAGLGRTLTDQIQQINAVMSTVSGALGNTLWRGPARDQFEADWSGVFVKALNGLNDAFGKAGQDCTNRATSLAQVMGAR
jgi:hypothetical protein